MEPYYEIEDDLDRPNRWHLENLYDDSGQELDSREFTYGKSLGDKDHLKCYLWNEDKAITVKEPMRITKSRHGSPLDFTFTDSGLPVVNEKVSLILDELAEADIQRFPVVVEGVKGEYEIVNIVASPCCIDKERSQIVWYESGNTVRPDLVGEPESIISLKVDPKRTGKHCLLRPMGWHVVVVASSQLKVAFEKAAITGIAFSQLS